MSSFVCLVVGFVYFTNLIQEIQTGFGKEIIYTLFLLFKQDFGFVLLCLLLLSILFFAIRNLLAIDNFFLEYNLYIFLKI